MPTKNLQMNSDEEVVNILKPLLVAVYDVEQTKPQVIKVIDETISKIRTALSQARKDEREKCGREIDEAIDKVDKLDHYCKCEDGTHLISFTIENYDGLRMLIKEIVSSLTGLNEK